MAGRLQNDVVIITGCSGGIGKQTAIRFAQEGAKLAICARRMEPLLETKALCEKEGVEVLALKCDVGVHDDLKNFVAQTVEKFGRIDAVLNNAVSANPGSPFMEQDEEYLQQVFNTGFLSTWRMMKLCYPYLKESRGRVVNFGSSSGLKGIAGHAAYASVKEAIRSLTRTIATEWGKEGIVCNAICPTALGERTLEFINAFPEGQRTPESLGFTIPPVGYVGEPYKDVTPALVFFASKECHYITGQTIRVDGGGSIFAL